MPRQKLSLEGSACIETAKRIARQMGHSHYHSGHLLLSFFEGGTSRAFIVLDSIGISGYEIKKLLQKISPPIGQRVLEPAPDKEMEKILDEALRLTQDRGEDLTGEHHLLMAMMKNRDSVACRMIIQLEWNPELIIAESQGQQL